MVSMCYCIARNGERLTQPAFAMPVMMLPPMMRWIVVADPETHEPIIPNTQPPIMNLATS